MNPNWVKMLFAMAVVPGWVAAANGLPAAMPVSVAKDDFYFASPSLETRMSSHAPGLNFLNIDGLALGRRAVNVLRESPALNLDYAANVSTPFEARQIDYRRSGQAPESPPAWRIRVKQSRLALVSSWSQSAAPDPFVLTFDTSHCHATVLGVLGSNGDLRLPALIHLPGQGSIRITEAGKQNQALSYTTSSSGDVEVAFPPATEQAKRVEYQLEITCIYPNVAGIAGDRRFDSFRRNWLNIFQLNPQRHQLANNSHSDSCAFCYYEYADVAAQTPPLATGLTALDLVRQTLETILGGATAYGLPAPGNFPVEASDALPSLLIAAAECTAGGNHGGWLATHYTGIKGWADKMLATDTNGNGLVKYIISGNSGIWPNGTPTVRPANWWDTIGFGHEDAYGNALAYRALGCMEHMAQQLGKQDDAARYHGAAEKLKAAYFNTFYDPATGVIGGWRSADGELHDYYFLWVNGIAIHYGLVPVDKANAIMDVLLAKMRAVGYTNFQMGLPGNLVSVPLKDYVHRLPDGRYGGGVREDNADGFQKYENGGATGCFVFFTLAALYDLGRFAEADAILFPMLQEFNRGGFEGRGDRGYSNDWRMWNGTPMGYEGFLTDNYYALLAVTLRSANQLKH